MLLEQNAVREGGTHQGGETRGSLFVEPWQRVEVLWTIYRIQNFCSKIKRQKCPQVITGVLHSHNLHPQIAPVPSAGQAITQMKGVSG